MKNLLLITGAGASYDVTTTPQADEGYKPPLTTDLFNTNISREGRNRYLAECLKENPLAYQAGDGYYKRLQGNGNASLEEYLAELKNSDNVLFKEQYWAIPIYLQELFLNISNRYLPGGSILPSNYKTLIDKINGSKYEQLIWLNLNYDLFADKAIRISIKKVSPLGDLTLNDYTKFETKDGKLKIKYTKPHGSVDWFKKITNQNIDRRRIKEGLGILSNNFEENLSDQIGLRDRLPSVGRYYPALTAPLGKDYGFIYKKHIDDMLLDLRETQDVLCIGFAALDTDILDLMKNMTKIIKLKIVNGTNQGNGKPESGIEAYLRMKDHCQNIYESKDSDVFNGGFNDFVAAPLDKWLSTNVDII